MEHQFDFIVIGLSAAGFYALEVLKANRPDASILAVSAESNLPYKRTAVDKKWIEWEKDCDKKEPFALADRSWFRENRIHLLTGCTISSINSAEKYIQTQTGEKYRYGKLLLAVGARPWKPPIPLFRNAYSVRTFHDALVLREAASRQKKCLVYGMGVEGVELAAQLRQMGLEVTLAGRGERLIHLQFSRVFSQRIEDCLSRNGIDLCFDVPLEDLEPHGEMLVYSLGIRPRTDLAEKSGLECEKGILVDSHLKTSDPDIFAAGECAEHPGGFCSSLWHQAQEQGRTAAENMCGNDIRYTRTTRRMKSELFSGYFFSHVPSSIRGNDSVEIQEIQRPDNGLLHLHILDRKVAGIEMADDSVHAKMYEKAVLENWPVQDLLDQINPL